MMREEVGFLLPGMMATTFVLAVLPLILFLLVIAYGAIRYRDRASEIHDPQIGIKVAIHFLKTLSILLLLVGLTMISCDTLASDNRDPMMRRDSFTPAMRTGLALAISGTMFWALHFFCLLSWTNDRRWPAARRFFVGVRFGIHTMTVMVLTTLLLVTLLGSSPEGAMLKTLLASLLVWVPSWVIHFVLFRLDYNKPYAPPQRQPISPPVVEPVG